MSFDYRVSSDSDAGFMMEAAEGKGEEEQGGRRTEGTGASVLLQPALYAPEAALQVR